MRWFALRALRFAGIVALVSGCAVGGADTPDSSTAQGDSSPGPRDGATRDAAPPRGDAGAGDADAGTSDADVGEVDAAPGPLCVGVDCGALDGTCTVGVCDEATGDCAAAPAPDGAACDDADACTGPDTCAGGACAGGPLDCSALDGACAMGTCDAALGCVAAPLPDGADCDSDPTDCVAEACRGGVCEAASAADCSTCSSGGTVCAAGVCGSTPPMELTFDFEGGIPSGWVASGSAGWTLDATRAHGGSASARSGMIGHSQSSSLTATFMLPVAADLSFWLDTSTESCCDALEVYVDGALGGRWAGATGWTQVTLPLGAAGSHTVEWRYTKDFSASWDEDRVSIDDVRVLPAAPTEDFEGGGLPTGYTSSGDATWFNTTVAAHSGSRSMQSGDIGNSQQTSLFRTITLSSASHIGFWYRTSTESSYDYLRVYIDGTLRNSWSGSLDWRPASYPVAAGPHTIELRYTKDSSASSGSDAVWIDDLQGGDPSGGSLCGP